MAVIQGSNGADDIFGTSAGDTIYGYGGADAIYGYGGNDAIYGGAGDDDLVGGTGANNLYGGSGVDWFTMSARGAGLSDDYVADFEFDIDRIDVVSWGISDFSQIKALLRTTLMATPISTRRTMATTISSRSAKLPSPTCSQAISSIRTAAR